MGGRMSWNRRQQNAVENNPDEDESNHDLGLSLLDDSSMEEPSSLGQQEEEDDDESLEWSQLDPSSIGSGDLATTILAFILRNSRQTRLWNAGSQSGRSDLHPAGSDDDTSEGEDFRLEYDRRPISPQAEPCPDTSRIEGSRIHEDIAVVNGTPRDETNITKILMKRQHNTLNSGKQTRCSFSQKDRIQFNERFLPNAAETMQRFRQKVFCGQYSTDGTVFLSACQDQHIRLFDTSNGRFKLFRDIPAKDVGWSIVDAAYSPDQRFLIYSSWSDCIHLCNIYGDFETHVPLDMRPSDARFCAFSVCFSQDNTQILAGGSDQCIYLYDRGSDKRSLKISGHYDDVNAVSFADDSSDILYSGSDDGLCMVWDRRDLKENNPKPVGTFAGHTDGVTYIDAKGDGRYLLSNSKDQTIKLWDMRRFAPKDSVRECRRIVSSSNWDYRWESAPRRSRRLTCINGDPSIMTYRGHSVLQTLCRARFSPAHTTEQKYIYTGCATGSVVLYDIVTGKIAAKLKGHKQCVRDISWHPFEQTIMSSSWDFTVKRWRFNRSSEEDFGLQNTNRKRTNVGRWSVSIPL